MEVKFVDLQKQYQTLQPAITKAMARVFERTDFVLGEDVGRFEEEFARYCEAKYAVGVDSGASALELGLRALGIGPGDEVLVPANSFIASASAVSATGAIPVFVDVDPETHNIDVQQIPSRITSRCTAIVAVHLYGQPAEMDAIMASAARFNLAVVEDACQAHGARYRGRRVGSIGHVAAFSFYPGKNLGAYGDGGALVTNDQQIAERVRILRNCGQIEKYRHVTLGGNHRLDTMQAAVLRVKLQHLDDWNTARRHWASLYDRLLEGVPVVRPQIAAGVEAVHHVYAIQSRERAQMQSFLTSQGIATGIHYPIPIHLQPAYADLGYHLGDFPVTERAASHLLSLPMFPELRADEVEFVANRVRSFVERSSEKVFQVEEIGSRVPWDVPILTPVAIV